MIISHNEPFKMSNPSYLDSSLYFIFDNLLTISSIGPDIPLHPWKEKDLNPCWLHDPAVFYLLLSYVIAFDVGLLNMVVT